MNLSLEKQEKVNWWTMSVLENDIPRRDWGIWNQETFHDVTEDTPQS